MPDHVHLLASGQSEHADVRRFVRFAKQQSGYSFRRLADGRLWQPSFWDRTLREDESTVATIVYIVNNPVRAGLVTSPDAYPHWGSSEYSREAILEFVQEHAVSRT